VTSPSQPLPVPIDVSSLPRLPETPADETRAVLELAEKRAGRPGLLSRVLARKHSDEALRSVKAALKREKKHRAQLLAAAMAVYGTLGEAVQRFGGEAIFAAAGSSANDDEIAFGPNGPKHRAAPESSPIAVDYGLDGLRSASERTGRAPDRTPVTDPGVLEAGDNPLDHVEIGRRMAPRAGLLEGGDMVQHRLRSIQRLQEESLGRTRQLEDARRKLNPK